MKALFGRSIAQTYDGGFIITGGRTSPGSNYSDVYLVRTDANGDTLWTKQYGMPGNPDFASSVKQTTDSGFILCGWMNNIFSYLIRVNSIGDTLWTRAYGKDINPIQMQFNEVEQTSDGGFIAIGKSDNFGAGSWDIYAVKTDANGDTLWTRTYGGVGVDDGYGIRQTSDGGYLIVGNSNSFGFGNTDVYLLRIDSASNLIWAKTFGAAGFDRGMSLKLSTDGGIIIVGITNSFGAGNSDIYLIKTDSLGNSGCHEATANAIITKPPTDRIEYPESISISEASILNFNCIVGNGGTLTDLCFTTEISNNSFVSTSNIEVIPNPAASIITLVTGEAKIESIILYNMLGEKVMEDYSKKSIVDISLLQTGVYIVQVCGGGKQWRSKIIKQ